MNQWAEYRSAESGLALFCPPGWSITEGQVGAVVAMVAPQPGSGGFSACVTINAAELVESPASLEEFTKTQLAAMGEFLTDVRLIDQAESSLLARPAERVLVAYRQGVHALALEQWWAVADTGPGFIPFGG